MKAATSLPAALLQGRQIVEGDLDRSGHQLAESLAEEIRAVQRERAGRQSMKCVIAVDDILPSGVAAGELDAVSTVSVPLLVKKTRERSSPVWLVSFSATSPLSRLQSMRTRLGLS